MEDQSGDETGPTGSDDYDVFLSFRGPDTRHGITDHLYESMSDKGIRVFRDDEEIRRGQEIGGELLRAIRGSQVYVVVFSRGYASSAWCLRELAMMMDCRRETAGGKVVLPIFYNVDPDDVKLRTELYRSALDNHRERYGDEGVRRWEEALVKAGGISGWDYKDYQGEGKLVRLVVQDALSKLKIRERRLPHHLMGIDDRVETVMNVLHHDSPDGVRVVMVYGMGGIGKTTLANLIFNRICSQFDGCSFLTDVRESSATEGGIAKLQKKLLGDILGRLVNEVGDSTDGINQIMRRLGGKRILIIFDDVSERSQLEKLVESFDFFGSGTRIIITTRDETVCKGLMRSGAVSAYEMKEMSDDHAVLLFNRHAFGAKGPSDDFADLSGQVVRTTGNLPLALEVIGGHLCGESKQVWEYTLQKLKRVPHKDVMKILRISYEGLEESEMQIFLDIACFLNEMRPWGYASYMWEACGFYPKCGVAVLQNKSLLKVLNDNEFGMHDLIRDMGREIVRSESILCHGMRSRLWYPEDALNVVHQKEGTNKVLAINLGKLADEHDLACEEFEGVSNLRFLQLWGGQFFGDFKNFRRKLMWLHWEYCECSPNPAFFNMSNLVVLTISGPGITDISMKDLRMGKLRVLEISLSEISAMPDLSGCSKLVTIILKSCFRLETLHGSIGKLKDLASLHIEDCEYLRSLTEDLGSLKALREVNLISCISIKELPESVGRLGVLRVLRVINTKISKLPASIGNLKSLEVLQIESCPLDEGIPLDIGGLCYLEELILKGCNLRQLPATIHHLSSLRSLSLSRCSDLRELPELPTSLTKLRVESLTLPLLPDLSFLMNLAELVLNEYGLRDMSDQRPLVHSPKIGNKLRELPELPSSLTKLRIESSLLLVLPDFSSLRNLMELVLKDYGTGRGMSRRRRPLQLPWLGKLHRLQRLDLHLSGIPVLSADLGSLSRLEELKLASVDISSISQLPPSLRTLTIFYLQTEVQWKRYRNLRFLHRLELHHSMLTEVRLSGLEMLGNLTSLTIASCSNLKKLSDLACLRRLSALHLICCHTLVDITGVEKVELLEELKVNSCDSLQSIPDLSGLKRLKNVSIYDCRSLLSVPLMVGECYLHVGCCPELASCTGPYRQYQKRKREAYAI